MSMLDGFFAKGFKAAKCKTLLKLTIPRIKLLRNRREIQLKQMRKDISKLLENGQEATARIRVEHIFREENMMAAQEILELFCELITVRLPIIEAQKECPLDLKEAISSICFAAPRCADLPELQQVQLLFVAKYGKEFVSAAMELRPDCGVNRQIIELLSIRPPSVEAKMKLLKEIAEEHELDWDPSSTEAEFLKPHEDLLNGPSHFTNASLLPLPKEKNDEVVSSDNVAESHADQDMSDEFDLLNLPEVPKESVRASAPENVSNLPPPVQHDLEHEQAVAKFANSNEEFLHSSAELDKHKQDSSVSLSSGDSKQFIPFANPPPVCTSDLEMLKLSEAARASILSYAKVDSKHSPTVPAFPTYSNQTEPTSAPTILPSPALEKQREQVISPPTAREPEDHNADLQDILAAARAAAETAERAASAARAAASLAEVRITDILTKRKSMASQNSVDRENQLLNKQESFSSSIGNDVSHGLKPNFNSSDLFSDEVPEIDSETSNLKAQNKNYQSSDLPQWLPSFEDDPYYTYQNLFTSKGPKFDEGSSTDSPIHNSLGDNGSAHDL